MKLKKVIISGLASVVLLGIPTQTFAASNTANNVSDTITAHEVEETSNIIEQIDLTEDDFGLSSELLNEARNSQSLDTEEKAVFNETVDQPLKDTFVSIYSVTATVAAVVGIVSASMAIVKGGHSLGKYAAKQAKVRLGLTAKQYKSKRLAYRSAITVAFGWTVALGFDDYFYGV